MSAHAAVVQAGTTLGTIVNRPSRRDLVRFAQAAGDSAPLHWDPDYAHERGFERVIVHGFLKAALMSQVVTEAFPDATVVSFRTEYRRPDLVDEELRAGGVVESDDGAQLTLRLWVENSAGERTAEGRAVVRISTTSSIEGAVTAP